MNKSPENLVRAKTIEEVSSRIGSCLDGCVKFGLHNNIKLCTALPAGMEIHGVVLAQDDNPKNHLLYYSFGENNYRLAEIIREPHLAMILVGIHTAPGLAPPTFWLKIV